MINGDLYTTLGLPSMSGPALATVGTAIDIPTGWATPSSAWVYTFTLSPGIFHVVTTATAGSMLRLFTSKNTPNTELTATSGSGVDKTFTITEAGEYDLAVTGLDTDNVIITTSQVISYSETQHFAAIAAVQAADAIALAEAVAAAQAADAITAAAQTDAAYAAGVASVGINSEALPSGVSQVRWVMQVPSGVGSLHLEMSSPFPGATVSMTNVEIHKLGAV